MRRLHRRVRGDDRHRRGGGAGAALPETDDYGRIMLKALADRLAEAFAEAHARARAARVVGLCAATRQLSSDELIAEKYQRHPAGAGLSRAARPHREGHDLPPARREQGGRHRAHRELRDVAGLGRVGALLRAIRRASTSASARSSATRSRTMRGARAGRWPRPSAGWRRCSTTILPVRGRRHELIAPCRCRPAQRIAKLIWLGYSPGKRGPPCSDVSYSSCCSLALAGTWDR